MGYGHSTDTALLIGCLALLGSPISQSLRVFILSLAIIDDVGAILVVAIGYTDSIRWGALALGAFGVVVTRTVARLGVRSIPVYFLLGVLTWIAVDASGIHATIRGVVLGLPDTGSQMLADAAEIIAKQPAAMHLRFLQSLVEVSADNNSTLVIPLPIDLLRRFLV